VSCHIRSIKYSQSALNKLKYLYDSHKKLELIQLLINLFNLEMKDNNPMALASKIKVIIHKVDAIGVNIDISLMAFIVMIQLLKNDKKSMNTIHFEGETSFYNISNSKYHMR
jgi:hypothetical protein